MAARKSTRRDAPLRSVTGDEKPAVKAVSSVAQAVESGTRRDELAAMRARIAKAIDDPDIRGADLAALSRRLLEIGKELDAIDVAAKQEAAESVETADEEFPASAV